MDRRILVNYRIDPDVLASALPAPFRPALVDGQGVSGICLIRLRHLRPAGLPAALGVDTPDGPVTGVYIPRRDTTWRAQPDLHACV